MPGALFFAARGNLGALRAATTPPSHLAHGADPHDDAYDDPYADPYADPYDPYAVHAAPGRLSRAEEAKAEAELLAAAEGFLSTSPSASLHMGHLWSAQADAEATAGVYQHAEYTLYADVLDQAPSSDEVQISLAEIRPLEEAVRTAHAEVLRIEMDLEVERAAAEAAAAGRAVGQAGEAARLTTLRRELASKEARGAEVEAQVQQLEERLGALEAQVEAQGQQAAGKPRSKSFGATVKALSFVSKLSKGRAASKKEGGVAAALDAAKEVEQVRTATASRAY